ncbi:hypothetical protein ACIRSU_23470 [Streptomyces sp. NPDC101160]|uniref:hypothetical protein n=1 Tax=Streptomyces sp. NPDC101160 TaxID=3366118 RepID=UPI003810F436
MTVRAAWLQSTGQTREDTRIALSALLTPSSGSATAPPLRSRPGIVPGGFALTGDSAMQCTIGTGRAVIQGYETAQGAYMIAVTAPESITIPDGDPQYGRIDVIELAVLDDTYDKSGATDAVIRLIKGTPSATPQIPASGPGSSFQLYTISVPAGTSAGTGGIGWTTGAVTTKHYPMTALGGIMPTSGFNGVYAGQYRDVSGQLQRWDGTAWVGYPKAIGGIAPNGTATTGSYAGQYRDNAGVLQRWDGAAWQYAEGKATILFSVAQTSMQTVPANAWTPITMNYVDIDDFNGWNGTDSFVVPRTGWWRVGANITWNGDSTNGVRGARIHLGGVGVPRLTWMTAASMGATSVGGDGLIKLTAGNVVQLAGYHNQAPSVRTLGGSGYYTSLTAQWIRS